MSIDFAEKRRAFDLPEGVIYLDGNSLGPLTKGVKARMVEAIEAEWGQMLISAWNQANWMTMPREVGDRVAKLIGAEEGSVVMGDTLSIKVFQALAAGMALNPTRKVILTDNGNFPSDIYIASGLTSFMGADYEVRVVDPEAVEAALDESIAVMMLTEVDYRTGRRHDMAGLTAKAHEKGIITVWDLAHSAGALDVRLAECKVDFSVGCTYKYLNSGPGGPAFIYVAPRHAETARPILSGWLGHESPFAFDLDYRPGAGIERMRVGTPPILQLAALQSALDVFEGVDMAEIHARAIELGNIFIKDVQAGTDEVTLVTPMDQDVRGSQVSFRHPEGYAIMQALIAHGVVGDFRAPDILRFGVTPLYLNEDDMHKAAAILVKIVTEKLWDKPEFKARKRVT